MGQMRVFVSHSSEDKEFCGAFVGALRSTGADIWYDEENLVAGILRTRIMRELSDRPAFIVVLSKAALASRWVQDECEWAYNLFRRQPDRIFLPVTAEPYDADDFNALLYLESMKRVEAPGFHPCGLTEAVARTCRLLSLPTPGEASVTEPATEEDVEALIAHGKALNAQKEPSRALDLLERACQLAPDSADAWINLGYTFNRLRRFDEALAASEHALLLDRASPAAWTRKGASLFNLRRYAEAIAACDEALTLNPRYPDAWSIKGMLLHAQGHYDEAVAAHRSAVTLDPNYADGWSRLADALLQARRFDDAVMAYDLAYALGGDAVACWNGKATALVRLGRTNEALKVLQQARPQALAALSAHAYLSRHKR